MLDKRSIDRNGSQDHCIGRLNNGPIIIESVPRVPNTSLGALLQLTREIAVRLDSRFWYRQVVWGRFVRGGVGCMITMPVISREFWLGHLGIPLAELMFPEYLKGKWASQFGIEQVTQVLEKMQGLDPEGNTVEPRRSVFGVLDPEHRQADGGVEGQAVCRSSKTVSNAEDRLPRTGNHHCSGSGYFLGPRGSRWQPLR